MASGWQGRPFDIRRYHSHLGANRTVVCPCGETLTLRRGGTGYPCRCGRTYRADVMLVIEVDDRYVFECAGEDR